MSHTDPLPEISRPSLYQGERCEPPIHPDKQRVAAWLMPVKRKIRVAESSVRTQFHLSKLAEVMCVQLKQVGEDEAVARGGRGKFRDLSSVDLLRARGQYQRGGKRGRLVIPGPRWAYGGSEVRDGGLHAACPVSKRCPRSLIELSLAN